MDYKYMRDILAQIVWEGWLINMVDTSQSNRTGADVKDVKEAIKKGAYKYALFQHKDKPICFALWLYNIVVETLSNFHSPIVRSEGGGLLKKKRG